MSDGEKELEQACLDLAPAIKIVNEPISSAEARGLAGRFAGIAREFVSAPLDIDRLLIARAVRYLTQVHAIPPMGDDTRWFSTMLAAVLEIARPNSAVDDKGREFLSDMTEGISSLM